MRTSLAVCLGASTVLAAAVLALPCLAASADVPAPAATAGFGHPLPFKATVTGSAQLTSMSTGTFIGAGTATLLGAVTNDGGVVAHFDQPSDSCPQGFASTNTETFTAANGDTLSIESTDVTCPVGPDHPSQFNGTGHWQVTGGTGRFKNSEGSGSYTGFADFGNNFAFTFTGTIS